MTKTIDSTTPAGRLMMQMVGRFAESERTLILSRTASYGVVGRRAVWQTRTIDT